MYIIECRDGKLYTGITNDLRRRLRQHNHGQGCRFTKYRRPVKLIFKEQHSSKESALKRESEVKGFSRKKKLALIDSG